MPPATRSQTLSDARALLPPATPYAFENAEGGKDVGLRVRLRTVQPIECGGTHKHSKEWYSLLAQCVVSPFVLQQLIALTLGT